MNFIVKYLLPTAALGMLAFGGYHVLSSQPTAERLDPPAPPARSAFRQGVAASGMVEAQTENVAVGAAIAGVVLEVYLPASDVGMFVKKGTPLFRVDDRHLQAQLKVQKANLASALANLGKLDAMPRVEEVPALEAKLRVSEANYRLMKDQADRARVLMNKHAISPEEYTHKLLNAEMAKQQWQQMKADLDLMKAGAWRPDKKMAQAAVELAEAQIEQTQTEIERATVRAPIDGHLLQVNIRPGEFVGTQPGQALVLLGDQTKLHVRVDIDEHDVPRFKPGTPGKAFLRGSTQKELKLTFVRLERYVTPKRSLTGANTERVDTRVLQAIYAIEPSDQPVFVGQQLDVFLESQPTAR